MKECPACRRCFPDHVNHCPNDGDATTLSIAGEPILDGRYQLEKRLGHGGMGVVFKARHIFLKTAHAIKVILPDLVGNDPMLVTRFRQEALAAAAIRHQNIIAVTDFGVARGTMPFLVMEFVQGKSLHDILAAEGALPPSRALEVMAAVGAGVGAAHRQNIVHRDLKPLNIMLQDDTPIAEAVKVLDFGLAKIKSGELLGSFVQAKTSGLMGSPFYMAPEQWSDEEPDVRADIYSLGVILYQMLGGDVPFKGTGIPSIMKKHLTTAPPTFSTLGVNVPPMIEAVVRHALEKDADNRPQTVEAFISELRDAVAQTSAALNRTSLGSAGAQSATIITPSPHVVSMPPSQSPLTTLRIRSVPPQSRVFINNISIGSTDNKGELTITDIQRGTHQLRILHDGYAEWEQQVECNGGECRVDAQLQSLMATSLPQMSSDQMAGTISANMMNPEQSGQGLNHSMMEAQRLRAQAAALEERARQEAEAQRREQERREQEERDRIAREELAREEEMRLRAQAEAREKAEAEARRQAEEEARRKAAEEEAARLRAEEARSREEAEAKRKAEEEAATQKREEEQARLRAEAAAAKKRAEEEALARKRLEEETQRLRAEREAAQKRAEEEARRRAEEERLRLEAEERRKAEIEAARQQAAAEARLRAEEEARKREQAEAQRRAEEERQRREREQREREQKEREQREREEKERVAAQERERLAREQEEERARMAATTYAVPGTNLDATQPQRQGVVTQPVGQDSLPSVEQQMAWQQSQPQFHTSVPPGFAPAAPRKSGLPMALIAGIVVLVLAVGGGGIYYMMSSKSETTTKPGEGPVIGKDNGDKNNPPPSKISADMVQIPGGTFQMGRNGGLTQEAPAHSVTVGSFYMDKTEVTNEEYAQFVQEAKRTAPSHFVSNRPVAGQEKWPVVNVSLDDAKAFAAWRSERDKVTYRLPSEEEWEYAARGGEQGSLFPWGNSWIEGRAAVKGTESIKPVGSYPDGKTRWGTLDMIGNVWEWTSSKASYYQGSSQQVKAENQNWNVIRGGSIASDPKGEKPISATYRDWISPSTTNPLLGFRLVRGGQ